MSTPSMAHSSLLPLTLLLFPRLNPSLRGHSYTPLLWG